MIEVLLKFYSCFMQGLESFLGGWDVVWDQVDINGGYYAGNELVGGLL
jgi:hypothetical protein